MGALACFVLTLVVVTSVGAAWGNGGRAMCTQAFGSQAVARAPTMAVAALLNGSLAAVVAAAWLSAQRPWVPWSAVYAAGGLTLVFGTWQAVCLRAMKANPEPREPWASSPYADLAGFSLEVMGFSGWRIGLTTALWGFAPPLGSASLVPVWWFGRPTWTVEVRHAHVRWQRGRRAIEVPVAGLSIERWTRWDRTPMLRLQTAEGVRHDLALAGTPDRTLDELVHALEQSSATMSPVSLPEPPDELQSMRDAQQPPDG